MTVEHVETGSSSALRIYVLMRGWYVWWLRLRSVMSSDQMMISELEISQYTMEGDLDSLSYSLGLAYSTDFHRLTSYRPRPEAENLIDSISRILPT